MTEISPIAVKVILDTDGLKTGVAQAKSQLDDFGNAAEGQTGKLSNLTSKLKGVVGGLVAFSAAQSAVQILKESVTAASDFAEQGAAVGQVFGAAAADIQKFADSGATALGQTKVQILDAAKQFGIYGKAAGLAGQDNAKFSTEMVQLATDLASFNNTSVDEAITALGSGLRGEAEPLRKFGVLLDDATMRSEAVKMGLISTTKDALTPQQKVLAAHSLIMAQTSTQQGDFARTSGGLANQQRILTAQFENLKIGLGTGLLPIVTKFVTGLNTVIDAISKLAKGDVSGVKTIFDNIAKSFNDFFGGGGLEKAVAGFNQMREKIVLGIVEMMPGIIAGLGQMLPKVIGALADMLPAIVGAGISLFLGLVDALGKVIPKVIDALVVAIPKLIKALVDALPKLIDGAVKLFLGLIDGLSKSLPQILQAVVGAIPKIVQTLVSLIPILIPGAIKLFLGIIDGLTKAIPAIISAVIKLIPIIVKTLIELIPQLIDAGAQLLKGLIKGLWDNAPKLLAEAAKGVGSLLIDAFKAVFGIKSPSKVTQEMGSFLGQGLAFGLTDSTPWAIAAAQNQADSVVGVFAAMLDAVQNLQQEAVQLASSVGAAWNSALTAVTFSMQQTGLSGSAALTAAQNALANTSTVGGVDFTAQIAQSIAAASSPEGGYALWVNPATGQTFAVQGSMTAADLASIGLGAGSGFVQATTSSGALTGNVSTGTNINVTNNITSTVSPAEIAQATVDAIRFNSGGGGVINLA